MNIATLVPLAEIQPDGGFRDFPVGEAQFEQFPYAAWTLENKVMDHVRGRVREAGYAVRVRYGSTRTVYAIELVCISKLGFTLPAHPADFERVIQLITKGAVQDGPKELLSGRHKTFDVKKGPRPCVAGVRNRKGA